MSDKTSDPMEEEEKGDRDIGAPRGVLME